MIVILPMGGLVLGIGVTRGILGGGRLVLDSRAQLSSPFRFPGGIGIRVGKELGWDCD
jgi:hypothetical protein